MNWIDKSKLTTFILQCQDSDDGGIADRPGNMADIFHTFFGISGLSLLGYFSETNNDITCCDKVKDDTMFTRLIDPTYALPLNIVEKLNLPRQRLNEI